MDRSTIKAVRIAALIHAREQGLLEGHSLNEIARVLAGDGEVPVNRSTILRNLRDLDEAIELRNRLVERLRNFSEDEGIPPEVIYAGLNYPSAVATLFVIEKNGPREIGIPEWVNILDRLGEDMGNLLIVSLSRQHR